MPHRRYPPPVTQVLAGRHEAIWLKLSALHAQVAAVARSKPQAEVAAATSHTAEALLRDCRPFVVGAGRLPMAAPDHGGLATQLGQALAALEAWESANSHWDRELNAFVWTLGGDRPAPVRRLRPKLSRPPGPSARMLEIRAKLAKRIEQFKRR